jgi:hypothetical protein
MYPEPMHVAECDATEASLLHSLRLLLAQPFASSGFHRQLAVAESFTTEPRRAIEVNLFNTFLLSLAAEADTRVLFVSDLADQLWR